MRLRAWCIVPRMKIYGATSSRARRALWACEEAGADYTFHALDLAKGEHKQDAYLAINPNAKVPAMVDGELTLFESGAIVHYIARKYPEAKLLPELDSPDYARCLQWLFWTVTELEQPLWSMGKHRFALPQERRVPAMLECAAYEWLRPAQILSQALEGHEFLVGDHFTVADIVAGHTLAWARGFKVNLNSAVLEDYLDGILARPAFQRTLAL